MFSYLIISDRTHKVVSSHATKEAAIESLESQGYEHHSGWTYRNPKTRDYRHVSSAAQYEADNVVIDEANAAGMTVDAYLQA